LHYHTTEKKQRQMPLDAWPAYQTAILVSSHRWMPVLAFMGGILRAGMPARAHDNILETYQGQAHEARLGNILGNPAERCGYTIFLDEKLVAVPVTFDIPAEHEAEKSIRRIARPYNYALVFTRVPGKPVSRSEQLKVFSKDSQAAQCALMCENGSGLTVKSFYVHGGTGGSGRTTGSGIQAGMATVQHSESIGQMPAGAKKIRR
jgi:hypothetical protein